MTRARLAILAASGSLALLAGAFIFQALGYAPCKLCLWQRWPHAAAILVGALVCIWPHKLLCYLGALVALSTAAIGAYHVGVELKWWEGPSSCTGAGAGLGGLSGDSLLSTETISVVMCDEIAFAFLGLSMAGWNMVFSVFFACLWLMAARRDA